MGSAIDARLRDCRCTRQRCAASLRAALQQLAELKANHAPLDWREAVEVETKAAQAAIEVLLTPAVVPQPVMSAIDREIALAVRDSLRPEQEVKEVLRPRNRSIVPRVKPLPEGLPEPAPEPPAPAAADGLERRLARIRARQQVAMVAS